MAHLQKLCVFHEVSDDCAVFTEPLAAAFRIIEQVQFHPDWSVAIVGDGKLANLIAQVISLQPLKKLVVFGKHQLKLDKILQMNIDKIVIDEKTAVNYVDAFDVCIEACGHPDGFMMAANMVKPLGTLVLKSTCAALSKGFNTALLVVKELNIIGSRCGNFTMALEALRSGKVRVDHLIDGQFSLENYDQAFTLTKTKGSMKVLFNVLTKTGKASTERN